MPIPLEIPPITEVQNFPKGNRAWMFVQNTVHHDARLELRCESHDGERILGVNLEMRKFSGQEGFSYNTGNAIGTIASQNEPEFPELKIGETQWRPAERKNGIIMMERKVPDAVLLTILNSQQRCSVVLSTNERIPGTHSIQLEEMMFRRFLALGGAMARDWAEDVGPASQFRGMSLEDALAGGRDFLL